MKLESFEEPDLSPWTVAEYEALKRQLKVDRKYPPTPPLPLDDECPEEIAYEPRNTKS